MVASHRARALAIVTILCGCGCGVGGAGEPSAPAPSGRGPGPLLARADGRVPVANVNGRPVYADCVQRQAAGHGISPADALQECIDFELLAEAAEAAGWAVDRQVREIGRREAVRALIRREFEDHFNGPEDIPRADLESAWTKLRAKYNHPEYRYAVFVRAVVDKKIAMGSPADRAAEAQIRRLHRALRGKVMSIDEFCAAAERDNDPAPLQITREPYNTPRRGRADPNFASALFAIPRIGVVSEPARTRWGWDLLLMTDILPARQAGLAEVENEVRVAIFPLVRERAFKRWLAQVSSRVSVAIAEDWSSQLGAPTPEPN
jgi:hypothetical protein